MKRSEYNKHFNNIRCSDEFREKMEERLKASPVEAHEYADSVNDVEQAKKSNRITQIIISIAACAAIAVGIGAVYKSVKNNPIDQPSDLPSASDNTGSADNIVTLGDFSQSILSAQISMDFFENSYFIPNLSTPAKEELAELFATFDWTPVEFQNALGVSEVLTLSYNDSENGNEISLTIDVIGRTTLTETDSNGNSISTLYQFSVTEYSAAMEIIAENILTSGFQNMNVTASTPAYGSTELSPEMIEELGIYFANCEYLDRYDSFKNPDGQSVVLEIGFCRAEICASDEISVTYTQGECVEAGCVYQLEEGAYDYIKSRVISYQEMTVIDETNIADLINNSFSMLVSSQETNSLTFVTDGGQFSSSITVKTDKIPELQNLLLSFVWEKCEGESHENFPYVNFYPIGNILLAESGFINVSATGETYSISEEDAVELKQFLDNMMADDELAKFQRLIENAEKSYTSMTANFTAEYDLEYVLKNATCGVPDNRHYEVSGSLNHNVADDTYYIDAEGLIENELKVKSEVIGLWGETVYIEHFKNESDIIDNACYFNENGLLTSYTHYNSRFEGINTVADYFYIDELAFQAIEMLRNGELLDDPNAIISDYYIYTENNGIHELYVTSEPIYSSQTSQWTWRIKLNENGIITEFEKTLFGKTSIKFSLTDIVLDEGADSYTPPELTEAEKTYFTMNCEEYAATLAAE